MNFNTEDSALPQRGVSANLKNDNLQRNLASIGRQPLNNNGKAQQNDNRKSMQSMGALIDFDGDRRDEENHMENRPHSLHNNNNNNNSTKNTCSTSMSRSSVMNTAIITNKNNENTNAAAATNILASTSNNLMRQQRRRLLVGGQVAASILTPHNNNNNNNNKNNDPPAWDGFVRKGTQFKSFLDDALQHVATGYAVTNLQSTKRQRVTANDVDNNTDHSSNNINQGFLELENAAASVAKDKTKEVLLLQQKLEEAQSQVAALTASNKTLREESTESSLRFERTIEALKISAANAACARTDADQAEVSAEGLSTQLEALKTVVEQTKQAAQMLHEEQEEIEEQARNGQVRLLQAQAELAESQKEIKQLKEKAQEWEAKTKELQVEATNLKRQLTDQTEQTRKLSKALEEREALEEARTQRSQEIEKELREAQTLLLLATSKEGDDDTLSTLQNNLKELQSANHTLHEQLEQQKKTSTEDVARLTESMNAAEDEVKKLRVEASLRNDRRSAEVGNKTVSPDLAQDPPFAISTTLNMRTSPPKHNNVGAVPPSSTCSICFKAAFGLMKTCQCGRPKCDKRAHLMCVSNIQPGTSVSHPCTPTPKLPVVLCSGALASIMNDINKNKNKDDSFDSD